MNKYIEQAEKIITDYSKEHSLEGLCLAVDLIAFNDMGTNKILNVPIIQRDECPVDVMYLLHQLALEIREGMIKQLIKEREEL